MGKLSGAIEPPFPGLRSAAMLPAERVLGCLSAYKTPRDKVQCVVRFVKCAMNLLSARSDGLPGADDLTPLLVYLLIKVSLQILGELTRVIVPRLRFRRILRRCFPPCSTSTASPIRRPRASNSTAGLSFALPWSTLRR